MAKKTPTATSVVRRHYVLPCLLLLLNLVNTAVAYKAERIAEPVLRTLIVMTLVLFGSALVAFVVAPGLERFVNWCQRASRAQAGGLGEVLFLLALGGAVFALYYVLCTTGIAALLPASWRH
jgi:hypothetical protein